MERGKTSKILVRIGVIGLIITAVIFAVLLGVGLKKTRSQTAEYNAAVEKYEADYNAWHDEWLNNYGRTTRNRPTKPMRSDYVNISNFVPCIITAIVGSFASVMIISIGKYSEAGASIMTMVQNNIEKVSNSISENSVSEHNENKTRYCAYCGTELKDSNHCPACGANNKKSK